MQLRRMLLRIFVKFTMNIFTDVCKSKEVIEIYIVSGIDVLHSLHIYGQ